MVATRSQLGAIMFTAAATASIMVTSGLGDSGVVRDPHIVIRLEHTAATAKILRSRMLYSSESASIEAEPQLLGRLSRSSSESTNSKVIAPISKQ